MRNPTGKIWLDQSCDPERQDRNPFFMLSGGRPDSLTFAKARVLSLLSIEKSNPDCVHGRSQKTNFWCHAQGMGLSPSCLKFEWGAEMEPLRGGIKPSVYQKRTAQKRTAMPRISPHHPLHQSVVNAIAVF